MQKSYICFSMRKHLLQKLNDSGVPAHQIVQISGHKNVNSINSYSSLNAQQSKNISNILSNLPASTTASSVSVRPTSPQFSVDPHLPGPMFSGNTFNGPVTINLDNTNSMIANTQTAICSPGRNNKESTPKRPWKRIRLISDSESD